MCRYACECRHPNCAQASDGCFVVGWPCLTHNTNRRWAFSDNEIRSRDADWVMTGEVSKALSRTGASDSKALPVFVHNKFERLANGTRRIVPKALDRYLARKGLIARPAKKWRDEEFEIYCAELAVYFKSIDFNPLRTRYRGGQSPEEVEEGQKVDDAVANASALHLPMMTSLGLTEILKNKEEAASTSAEEDGVPPAWTPSRSEVSLLLKTPPPSPTETLYPDYETEAANSSQALERPQLYSAEDRAAIESLNYLPLNPSPSGLDKLDAEGYGLSTTNLLGNNTQYPAPECEYKADEDTAIPEEDLENMTFIPSGAVGPTVPDPASPTTSIPFDLDNMGNIPCLAPGNIDWYLKPPTAPPSGLLEECLEPIACLQPGVIDEYLRPPPISPLPTRGLGRSGRTVANVDDESDEDEDKEMMRFGGPLKRPGVSRRGPYQASDVMQDPDAVDQHDIFMRLVEEDEL